MQELAGVVRHVLTILAGSLITKGYVDEGMIEIVSGAVVALGTVAWSIYQKRKAAK